MDHDIKEFINSNITRDNLSKFFDQNVVPGVSYMKWINNVIIPWDYNKSVLENRMEMSGYLGYLVIKDFIERGDYSDKAIDSYAKIIVSLYEHEVKLLYENYYEEGDMEDIITVIGLLHWNVTQILKVVFYTDGVSHLIVSLEDLCYDMYSHTLAYNGLSDEESIKYGIFGDDIMVEGSEYYGLAVGLIVTIVRNIVNSWVHKKDINNRMIKRINYLYDCKDDYIEDSIATNVRRIE